MDNKNIILAVIVVLIIVVIGIAAYSLSDQGQYVKNATDNLTKNTNNSLNITKDTSNNNTNNSTVGNQTNKTLNDTNKTNKTYKVYDPQIDGYVDVIGEKYDTEFNKWYTYDADGVRYYNTRIKNQ